MSKTDLCTYSGAKLQFFFEICKVQDFFLTEYGYTLYKIREFEAFLEKSFVYMK
jgi:hypothetical protein